MHGSCRSSVAFLFLVTAVVVVVLAHSREAFAADRFDLKGRVLDPDGKPVAGARVFIANAAPDAGNSVTAADGSYVLQGLYERTVTLQISREGYFERTLSFRPQAGAERDFCLVPQNDRAPWIGVEVDEQPAEGGKRRVLRVSGIDPDSPAAQAGISYGDEIVSYDGKAPGSEVALFGLIAHSRVGGNVNVVLAKRGQQRTVGVKVGRRQTTDETESVRQAAARAKVFEPGTLIYYRDAAIARPADIGSVQRRSYMIQKAGTVDVVMNFAEGGEYQVQVIAYTAGQGKDFPTWSFQLDGRELQSFTTDSTYFHIYETRATVKPGKHTFRVAYNPQKPEAPPLFLYALRVLPTEQAVQTGRRMPPPTPIPAVSVDDFIKAQKEQGNFLWSKEDPESATLIWVAIKDQFVVLLDKNAPQPIRFDTFLSFLPNPKQNVTAFLFTPTAIWAGCDHGLFQYDRRLHKWYQWAVNGRHIDAEVTKLDLAPGGRLVVTFSPPGEQKIETAAFDTIVQKWVGQ